MQGQLFGFVLGSDKVPKGVNLAIETMKETEIAKIIVEPEYAFGHEGLEGVVPPDSTLFFEVEITGFCDEGKTKDDYPDDVRLQMAKDFKEDGNLFYKHKNLLKALEKWEAGNDFASKFSDPETIKLIVSLQLNLALVQTKLQNFTIAVAHANKALKLDEKNVKAMYRRAEAKSAMGDHEGAMADILEALKIEPENKDLKQELDSLKVKLAKAEERDKKIYKSMFG